MTDSTAKVVVPDRTRIQLTPKSLVQRESKVYRVAEILDFESVLCVEVETGRKHSLRIQELSPYLTASEEVRQLAQRDIEDLDDADWEIAQKRFEAIKPLLEDPLGGRAAVYSRAKELQVDPATLYRWIQKYRSLGVVAALVPRKRGWRQGNTRISQHVEAVITKVIEDVYMTSQRSTAQKVIREVVRRCKAAGLEPPNGTTVRVRIQRVSEKKRLMARGYKELAANKFTPTPGSFPGASFPLSVVQIDHTPADLMLVDEVHRKPIGRPWITLAIDVFSRMVTGYYLSFDPPSETSVAMCVAHSILPKEEWLAAHDVEARWDVWGVMTKVHTDNGSDFRSDNFQKACLAHDIVHEFRPVKRPRYGGHIERLLGTFMSELHDLPGTTFSNIKEREDYDSEKQAVMTKSEFERWLVTLICKFYHQRPHASLGMPPVKMWEIGIFGNSGVQGTGLPARVTNRMALMLDFLPAFHRTLQPYGVAIDGLRYYADVLRPHINATDPKNPKLKRKFIFRRDPRDISVIWFYDSDLKEYYRVPFANQQLLPMSVWEFHAVRDKARREGMKSVNESLILQGTTEMRAIVEEASAKTKKARRQAQRRLEHEKRVTPAVPRPQTTASLPAPARAPPPSKSKLMPTTAGLLLDDVEGFDVD